MPQTTIRRLQGDDILDAMYLLPMYSFRSSPPLPDRAEWEQRMQQRRGVTYVAAYDGETVVGCAGASALTQNVRGALLSMAGVHNVATHPAERRKGNARAILAHLLSIMRDDGKVLSCLYPFRESFYERIGYVTLPLAQKVTLNPLTLLPLLKKSPAGTVEMKLLSDGYAQYRDFLARMQPHVHGMAFFDEPEPAAAQRANLWLALASAGGEIAGMMLYDLQGDRIADFTMRIRRFYYLSSAGKYLLLNWIARHVDQASKVDMWLPPFERPETWLDDLKVTAQAVDIAPMGRVLDVAHIGGMCTGPGCFSVHVSDPFCPWNDGIWKFASVDGRLQVTRSDAAECELGIQAISALVYGAHNPADFAQRGWGAPSAALQQTMMTMFPPLLPHLHETF